MPTNTILDSLSMRTILKHVSFDSVLLIDLDNTVIESQSELGSDQWFVQLCIHATTVVPDKEHAIAMVIALYHEVQKFIRAQAVEDVTVKIINTLQDIGIPVIAITARDQCLQQATIRQLADIGVHLSDNRIPRQALSIAETGRPCEQRLYENGIIFCGGKDKGACFKAFLDATGFNPKHVVMADDKLKHLEHVKAVAESSNIRFNGIRYGYLDAKVAGFDIQEAHMQLAFIKHRLPSILHEHIQTLNVASENHADAATRYPGFFYHETESALANGVAIESSPEFAL